MKPKVVVVALFVAIGVLGAALLLSYLISPRAGSLPAALDERGPASEYAGQDPANTTAQSGSKTKTPPTTAETNTATSLDATNTTELTAEAREEYIRQRVDDLDLWSSKRDPISRDKILAELQNSEKEIREAALAAAIDLNDRSVVPRLREVAELTPDAIEKAKILEAVDFINLPSLTERLAQAANK